MRYSKTNQYIIMPTGSYQIIRQCPGCAGKSFYQSTNKFRINANGNRIDVWLIYQCEKCGHTYNMTVYERVNPGNISKPEYEGFLRNDKKLALQYGNDKQCLLANKAEIDWNHISYKIVGSDTEVFHKGDCIELQNPYELKLRADKVLPEILHVTRSKIKQLLKLGLIEPEQSFLGKVTRVAINGDISKAGSAPLCGESI